MLCHLFAIKSCLLSRSLGALEKYLLAENVVGLSNASGCLELYIPHDAHGGYQDGLASFRKVPDSHMIRVPVKTLDEYSIADVDFIKIDVEGHESEVLEGARETIEKYKPVLLVEIEQRHLDKPINEVLDHIVQMGYEGFYLLNDGFRAISDFSYEENQLPYLENVFEKRYINNFFFSCVVNESSRFRVPRRLRLKV